MSYQPPSDADHTPPPGAMPPYGYAPLPATPPTSGAAMASLVLGILSHIPGSLTTLIVAPLSRAGYGPARIGVVFTGIAILSALIAIGAITCGHVARNRLRALDSRGGNVAAIAGLTLGYSQIAGVVISLVTSALVSILYR